VASKRSEPSRSVVGRLAWTTSLLRTLTPREFRIRYRASALDLGWSLITPVALLLVYGVILTGAFDVTGGCAPYLSTAWAGLVVWAFFSSAVGSSAHSLLVSSDLVSKVYFPREAIPLAEVGVSLIDLAIGLVTFVAVFLVQGVPVTHTVVAAVPAILLVVIWSAAISIFAAVLSVLVRDVGHAVGLGLRLGFFATPVMYEADALPERLGWIAVVNPVAVAIGALRDSVLCGTWPSWSLLGAQLVVGIAVLAAALWYVGRIEDRLVDVL
jgi:ABC-type polysaccharide/polyol phosphate export permease